MRLARSFALCTAAALAAAGAGGTGGAGAAAGPGAPLQGTFAMAGRITDAVGVPGETRGLTVLRAWTFAPACPGGSCRSVTLTRARANGADTVSLHRITADRYGGGGSFYAPVRCAGTIYPGGERVSFLVTVRITAVTKTPAGRFVTRVKATYESTLRRNLTPCVAAFGHDAAHYHGHVVPAGTA